MAGKVIDFHVHPLPTLEDEKLLQELDSASVELCVLLAVDVDPSALDRTINGRPFTYTLVDYGVWDLRALDSAREILRLARTPNRRVAELVRRHPRRFVGFGSVNPTRSRREVEEGLEQVRRLGLKGIKLLPTLQMFSPDRDRRRLEQIFEFCRTENWIIVYHTGCDPGIWEIPALCDSARPELLEPILKKYRDVPVVLAHMGAYSSRFPGIWFEDALKVGKRYSNVWFDVAAVPYLLRERPYVEAIRQATGLDRVLFGSDYPVVYGLSIADAAEEIRLSPLLTGEEKEKILYYNAKKLLKDFNLKI